MQKMSVFLSNFTEVGLFNFDIENKYPDDDEIEEYQEPILHLGNPGNFSELVRFGIMHNFINNFKTRIKRAGGDEAAEYGTYKIEGKFVADCKVLDKIEKNNQVVFRYCDKSGNKTEYPLDPNGSLNSIAGICNDKGNVFGLMPHPERYVYALQHPAREGFDGMFGWGKQIFQNAVDYII